jgi:diphthamide biosynthesis protein 2
LRVQQARDARIAGIIAQTTSVAGYLYATVLRHLERAVQRSGRKAYTLLIGKINPHKLANLLQAHRDAP